MSSKPLPFQGALIALKLPFGSPGPPVIGIFLPPRVVNWTSCGAASSAIPPPLRSLIASPSACCTLGLLVFRPLGVCTGSLASNCVVQGGVVAPSARVQKRRKRIAPREL